MIIEHTIGDKYQKADKNTDFFERLEKKQANQSEIEDIFSFLDKDIYEALPLMRKLDESGHPILGHHELPAEKSTEVKVISGEEPVPLDLVPC